MQTKIHPTNPALEGISEKKKNHTLKRELKISWEWQGPQ